MDVQVNGTSKFEPGENLRAARREKRVERRIGDDGVAAKEVRPAPAKSGSAKRSEISLPDFIGGLRPRLLEESLGLLFYGISQAGIMEIWFYRARFLVNP
jgi:hypothetical protein